jgi:uncharacterized membrane protein
MTDSGAMLYFFMTAMLVSGTANTLLMKFQVMQTVPSGHGHAPVQFNHPFFQTILMMIGELLCLGVYLMQKHKPSAVPHWIFMIPCLCDWTATTLVNCAFIFVPASIVQMTRGAIVIFTCTFSCIFLGRRQHRFHYCGVGLVFLGITLVSLSAFFNPMSSTVTNSTSNVYRLVGISLCIGAQVFQASMLVYEEKILHLHNIPPLKVVGMEGLYGVTVGVGLLFILNPMGVESTPAAMYQVTHSTPLLLAVCASILTMAVFNFTGVTVTQKASATSRATIDCARTILIWMFELIVGWNAFNILQLIGFLILALGVMIYNRILVFSYLEPNVEEEPVAAFLKEKKKNSSNV